MKPSSFESFEKSLKTTVVRKLLHKDVNVIEPTLGFNIDTIQYDLNSESYNVNVWDVGGQKSIRTFWKNYFEKTEGLIWVVDCGDRSRLAICREEMHKVRHPKPLEERFLDFQGTETTKIKLVI